MKFAPALVTVAALLSANLVSAAAGPAPLTPAEIDGKWKMIDRVCSDGSPAADAFVVGRDSMTLEVDLQTRNATVHTEIDGKASDESVVIDPKGELTYTDSAGQVHTARLSVFAGYKLVIDDPSSFGEGGSCKPGQTISVLFQRMSPLQR